MHRWMRGIAAWALMGLMLACSLGGGPTPTKSVPLSEAQPTALPEPTEKQPDPTALPKPTAAKPTQTPAENTPTATAAENTGPFTALLKDGKPLKGITDLWVSPEGEVWVSAASGVFVASEQEWVEQLDTPADAILGADSRGWVWVVLEGGTVMGALAPGEWIFYGEAEGWLPLPEPEYLSPGLADEIVEGPEGDLWLATGMDEVRRFSRANNRWTVLDHRALNFPEQDTSGYQGYFLTDVSVSGAGKVWVGGCVGKGEGMEGAGIARYSNGEWNPILAAEGACVLDMAVDRQGTAYAGTYDVLLRYNPNSGSWGKEYFPDGINRTYLVRRVAVDPQDRPWMAAWRRGGASLEGSTVIFHLERNYGWMRVYETTGAVPSSWAILPDDAGYLSAGGQVLLWKKRTLSEVGELRAGFVRLAVDGKGRLFAAALGGEDEGLWVLQP